MQIELRFYLQIIKAQRASWPYR